MAKRASRTAKTLATPAVGRSGATIGTTPALPGTTGRSLVLLKEGTSAARISSLGKSIGFALASSADFAEPAGAAAHLEGDGGLVFPDLGVAVINAPPEHMHGLTVAESADVVTVEPERIVYATAPGLNPSPPPRRSGSLSMPSSVDYLRGYRDAVNHLCDQLIGTAPDLAAEGLAPVMTETENTWGLQVTKVPASQFSAKGIRVAVLDTGLDVSHPDFAGRQITTRSFVQGEPDAQDGHGHGTHCIGTSCGPRQPQTLPRYGIGYEAEIFAGKVLSNQGRGADGDILAGIQWAITNGCAVVSMSLGAPVQLGQTFSAIFEQAASRALAAGTLIIAAAGNESRRPQFIAPVDHPANCPSIMAVAAVDRNSQIAWFSCGGLNPQGGQVDIAGPGVDVRSSWPRPMLYNTISGTSMATPHVAGIAALWAQSNADYRGRALMSILTQSAWRMTLPARDVGAGLVQAP